MGQVVLPFFATVEPCRIGIEACGSGHYWARELGAFGHDVRLMAPSYVKPYVKRQKNDAADAEAICEAVSRPTMRFVPVKTVEQQSVMVLHRTRLLLMRQRDPGGFRAGGIWLPGSAWCRDRTRAAVRTAWVASASKVIDTCGRCWSLARWR
jgi:hypothetical protein